MRSLANTVGNNGKTGNPTSGFPSSSTNGISRPYKPGPKDLSNRRCYRCNEMGHYASYHYNEPQQRSFESLEAPPVVDHVGPAYVKGAVQGKLVTVVEDYKMDEEAATFSGPAITRGGIKKIARKPKAGINRQRVQYAAHQEAILPEQQDPADLEDEDMDFLQDIQDTALSQDDSTKNHTQIPGNQRLPLTRTTKTGKIQELVQS